MPPKSILALLKGGDRRSIGRAGQVAAMVAEDPGLFPELMAGLWSGDALVRMRAADAAEKATRGQREILQPYKRELLGLMAQTGEQELRWHLAAMIPRLRLNPSERQLAISAMYRYLKDRSSIVKTSALQGLAELTRNDPVRRQKVIQVLRESARNGTPAMKARSRKLLLQIEGA